MQVQTYKSLFNKYKGQPEGEVFAHFHPDKDPLTGAFDFDAPFKKIAAKTLEGPDAWDFTQAKYQNKYHTRPPKLRNYLLYTFARLRDLELSEPGKYFLISDDGQWSCFNSGLQDKHSADLFMIYQKYQPLPSHAAGTVRSDWVYRGTVTSREQAYRGHFGTLHPELAWYSNNSQDGY